MRQNIKNLSTTFTKADCYTIKANGEWAEFYIDEWGSGGFSLSIRSSFGNWAHGWGSLGGTYVDFIKDLDAHYLASKFGANDDWDGDLFERKMKRRILEYRRDESISKETARLAWDELGCAVDSSSGHRDECFRILYHESESGFYNDSEIFDCGDIPNRQFTAFFKLFWPLFCQAVKERKAEQEKLAKSTLTLQDDGLIEVNGRKYVPTDSLVGLPTDTTAVDGRTIHVGDVCKDALGREFRVVFENHEIIKQWTDKTISSQHFHITNGSGDYSDLEYTILKKYNDQ